MALAVGGGTAANAAPAPATTSVSGTLETVVEGPDALTDWTGWRVQAWVTGGTAPIASADASADGDFSVAFGDPVPADGIAYLTASAPAQPDGLTATMALAIPAGAPTSPVTVNERTTVAMAYSMAQFISNEQVTGLAPGLRNSAAMTANLADPATGALSTTLTSSPNGEETSTLAAFDSLTAALAACVNVPFDAPAEHPAGRCSALVDAATVDGEAAPTDTLRAFASIARSPGADPVRVFTLTQAVSLPEELPVLDTPPAAWTIAIRFDGDGESLDGPGNFAIDHEGNIWVNNNYEYAADPHTPVCDSKELFRVSPTGEFTTFTGGGLSGVGYGIDLDPATGNVWVSNFGFAAPAPLCPEDQQPPHNSLSAFTPAGVPISPDTGFTQGDVFWPQGMTFAADGSIWTANCGNDSVTVYADADPAKAWNLPFEQLGLEQPFDVVDNGRGMVISGIVNSSVVMVDYAGNPLPESPGANPAFDNPMGLASDAHGNVWVSNSSLITLPCPTPPGGTGPFADGDVSGLDEVLGSVALITPDGTATEFEGGGTTVAWGISTDGDGNVWVANFAGKRLSAFCGADPSTCPAGLTTGDAISPDVTGFFFDGLTRNTATAVDQSGNVWVTNNWLEVPIQSNPGGHQIVAFLGLATPTVIAPPTGGNTPQPGPDASPAAPAQLPSTGVDLGMILLIAGGALVLIAVGVAVVFAGRRRRSE
ncbi:LPXTG cell wall anchor domain-containing protein [Agromyces aerolatus]|uniref:LPXTG cell wall anchor domain-containing protein n=1 Tax=Agromyces sp. LY-1074 TaxID=3074080 RepID=UPI002854D90B|nr:MULTISPECIES: LPXTG cell wall anchor domain-containing protein [unclassified Agromyces]MDR5699590.1 LPXTG cell wall anchor domain-containing protein [Agromyces sp. LY-1074]MDR5705886.1 LPXTG cell wall anchor domain-containing protein [Agromyces sp. LY-1358]